VFRIRVGKQQPLAGRPANSLCQRVRFAQPPVRNRLYPHYPQQGHFAFQGNQSLPRAVHRLVINHYDFAKILLIRQ
jgi:hypothetical protein